MLGCELSSSSRVCRSQLDGLNLVIDLEVKLVEIADQVVLAEWQFRRFEAGVAALNCFVETVPFVIHHDSLVGVLLDAVDFSLLFLHLKGLVECIRVDLLEDGFKSNEGLLQDLMPMVFGKVDDDWDQHGESLLFVCFQDVQEVVVLKEAHGAISNLQVVSANRLYDTLEEADDQSFDILHFANFKDFL